MNGALTYTSELVALPDNATSTGEAQMPKIAQIGFHKPEYGKAIEYIEMERKQWKPIHQERVNRGILNASPTSIGHIFIHPETT